MSLVSVIICAKDTFTCPFIVTCIFYFDIQTTLVLLNLEDAIIWHTKLQQTELSPFQEISLCPVIQAKYSVKGCRVVCYAILSCNSITYLVQFAKLVKIKLLMFLL